MLSLVLPAVDASVLMCGALVSAGACGALLSGAALQRQRADAARRRLLEAAGVKEGHDADLSISAGDKAVAMVIDASRRVSLGAAGPFSGRAASKRFQAWFEPHARKAGLQRAGATAEGLRVASFRMGATLAATFGLIGAAITPNFAVFGAVCGAVVGGFLPTRAIVRLQQSRVASLQRELPEMLEVVALGLRSGLSFDRGFQLYCEHFSSPFAQSCESARRMWTFGLSTREQALRELAASYDSPQLERVISSIVRSLRFGTSLADVLEQAAADSRQAHKAHVQELVAKAPVKMMIPTGTLILPAMLLLVLGPVLLEMMKGF